MLGIAYPLEVDLSTGGLKISSGAELIRQHIFSVLETAVGEQLMRPAYGTEDYLFESIQSPAVAAAEVERALHREVDADLSVVGNIDDAGQLLFKIYWQYQGEPIEVIFPRPSLDSSLHPDTIAYRDRILSVGGSISDASLAIVDQYLVRPLLPLKLKANWSQLLPIVGNNLQAAQVALYGQDAIAVNHTQASYRENVGLIGDPANNRYVNSQIPLNAIDSQSFTVFFTGSNFEPDYGVLINFFGCLDADLGQVLTFSRESGLSGRDGFFFNGGSLLLGSRSLVDPKSYAATSSADLRTIFTDGLELGQSANTSVFTYTSSAPLSFQARTVRFGGGTTIGQLFSRFNFRGSAIASYLDPDEVALLTQCFDRFNTALGR